MEIQKIDDVTRLILRGGGDADVEYSYVEITKEGLIFGAHVRVWQDGKSMMKDVVQFTLWPHEIRDLLILMKEM